MITDVNELIGLIEGSKRQEKKTSLDNMFSLCNLFDNPQEGLPIIHVGGTNGKGSTVTYIKSVLMEAGFNVGAYISPYVVCFNERISINNDYISDNDLLKYGNLVVEKCRDENICLPPFFDFVTLIAFLYFKDLYNKKLIDYIILEVGMGGIYDSTNVCNPLVSIITNVDYDHMSVLGNSLEEIWENKLGILKENTPLICFKSKYDELVINKARSMHALGKLRLVRKDDCINVRIENNQTKFDYLDYKDITLNLLGKYQAENAALAIETINTLNEILDLNISEEVIKVGLKKAFWPGRLEIVNNNPLVILDGAHNVDAINRLYEFIKMYHFAKSLRLVIAISANKEVEKMIRIIEPLADEVIYTEFNYKRSDTACHLYELSTHKNKILMENDGEIKDYILKDNNHDNILFGSLYFVSEMRKKFK